MLLRRMADFQPLLVADAYTALGASRADYLAAHHRWQSLLRSRRAPTGLDLYRAVLGPADTTHTTSVGDLPLTAYAWRLPGLWPDLRWEVVFGPDPVVLSAGLVRSGAVPDLPAPERLPPWSCVLGDVLARYPSAEQLDPDVPTQWVVRVGPHDLWFAHGLFQAVRPRS